MEIAAFCISIFSVLFTVIIYIVHDGKIKKQEKIINDYQIQQHEKEKLEMKKARIEAVMEIGPGLDRLLRIYNRGYVIARNVVVAIPDNCGLNVEENPFPINIKPNASIAIRCMSLTRGELGMVEIVFEWGDEFSDSNSETQIIQF